MTSTPRLSSLLIPTVLLASACVPQPPSADDAADEGADTQTGEAGTDTTGTGEAETGETETGEAETGATETDTTETDTTETDEGSTDGLSCMTNADCPGPDWSCMNGTCVNEPDPCLDTGCDVCTDDADCPEGYCEGSICVAAIVPEPCPSPDALLSPLPLPEAAAEVEAVQLAIADVAPAPGEELILAHSNNASLWISVVVGDSLVVSGFEQGADASDDLVSLHIDDDGQLDLLWGPVMLLGDGTGGFEFIGQFNDQALVSQRVADVDGDGLDDLIGLEDEVHPDLWMNVGGAFQPTQAPPVGFELLAVGDFDSDQRTELAGPFPDLGVFSHDFNGMGWGQDEHGTPPGDLTRLYGVQVVAGGADDLLGVLPRATGILLELWVGSPGGLGVLQHLVVEASWADFAFGDFDGDGDDEALALHDSLAGLIDFQGAPEQACYQLIEDGFDPLEIATGDLDGDGDDEIATLEPGLGLYAIP